jgi:hypothetical protein
VVETPSSVWVAVALFTKAVAVNDRPVDQPMTGGRAGIFSRPQATVEERLGFTVVAVALSRAEADRAVELHRAANSSLAAEYTVAEHPVGISPPAEVAAEEPHGCIGCGKVIAAALTRCPTCQQKFWDSCRGVDPDWDKE